MQLSNVLRFQKTLALAANASNEHEALAAELAARRLIEAGYIDPTRVPDRSFVSHVSFTDNPLLAKLRAEWLEAHPPPPPREAKSTPGINGFTLEIPFNINGFRKHNKKRKSARAALAAVPIADADPDAVEIGQIFSPARNTPAGRLKQIIEVGTLLAVKKAEITETGAATWTSWLETNALALGFESRRTAARLLWAADKWDADAAFDDDTASALLREVWRSGPSKPGP